MSIETYSSVSDWANLRESFHAQLTHQGRTVRFMQFAGYDEKGKDMDKIRTPKYNVRSEIVWLSSVKAFDTTKGGYFTTGDLDVNSAFEIKGFSPAYEIYGVEIPEYAGDKIEWNGKRC